MKSRLRDDRLNYGLANAFQIMKKNYTVAYPKKYALRRCDPRGDFKGFRKFISPLKYRIGRLAEASFDLIYSAGLYDYLREGGAARLTRNLFDLLKPGGSLIIGNFSLRNPLHLRFPMEYLYDWVLIHRDEKAMARLAGGIPDADMEEMTLLEEPLGINYFLKIVKRG